MYVNIYILYTYNLSLKLYESIEKNNILFYYYTTILEREVFRKK
jgi:hypothetical protein